ncbi:50S ribosomal protein L29 [Deferribacteraceae bacterium V6Fe1]|jgi:large subunit ribosomal protein L29|uniref:50S ribosomal protein L29 n=1 Tax=Deferrivibrio essentukiensis TaxID=2880922 RepID=UPI0019B26955|nr:50S ribosomal protein L29 [Deferrivibrio essentukiensis]MBC7195662.1 50S ribosomal protein L29 [Deferribacterales bacterium]MBZ4672527.1 ribosomal protein [Deferribacteraceae bacterium]MCB4205116.1 50S ribosomal protein L29 [Deferrivibrio essentukiensis]UOD33765.1 50S ribosomal protein L29 [Deferribacteraceae bacterium V6Fe1]
MKAAELRNMSVEELNAKHGELKENLFRLKFKMTTGDLEDVSQINKTKKDIARILTIINEKRAEG